jgi:hypothetical protein
MIMTLVGSSRRRRMDQRFHLPASMQHVDPHHKRNLIHSALSSSALIGLTDNDLESDQGQNGRFRVL